MRIKYTFYLALFLLSLFFCLQPPANAITRYISPAGSGDGLSLTNPTTFASAIAAASDFDTIIATNGTYGSMNLGARNGILLRSYNKWGAKIVGSAGVHGIYGNDGRVSNTVDGFWVFKSYIDGIKFNQNYCSISNCYVEQSGRGDPSAVTNTTFSYTGQGIAAHDVNNLRITHNVLADNGMMLSGDHGIYINGTNIVIAYNVSWSNMCWGFQIYNSPGGNDQIYFHHNIAFRNGSRQYSPSVGGALTVHTRFAGATFFAWNNTLMSPSYVCIHNGNGTAGTSKWTNNIIFGSTSYNNVIPTSSALATGNYNWQNQNIGGDMSGPNDVVTSTGTPTVFFPNIGSGNFWLTAGSTARTMTVASGVLPTLNFWGGTRVETYCGATEYSYPHTFDPRNFILDVTPNWYQLLTLGSYPLPELPAIISLGNVPGDYFQNCAPTYFP